MNHRNWSDTALKSWSENPGQNESGSGNFHYVHSSTHNHQRVDLMRSLSSHGSQQTLGTAPSQAMSLHQQGTLQPNYAPQQLGQSVSQSEGPIPLFSINQDLPRVYHVYTSPHQHTMPFPSIQSATLVKDNNYSNFLPNPSHVHDPSAANNNFSSVNSYLPYSQPTFIPTQPYYPYVPNQPQQYSPAPTQPDLHVAALRLLQSVLDNRYSSAPQWPTPVAPQQQQQPVVGTEPPGGEPTSAAPLEGSKNVENANTTATSPNFTNVRILRRPHHGRGGGASSATDSSQISMDTKNSSNKAQYQKSLEEREAEYAAARLRIMGADYPEEVPEDAECKFDAEGVIIQPAASESATAIVNNPSASPQP